MVMRANSISKQPAPKWWQQLSRVPVICLTLWTGPAAWAETACVRCSGPDQVYACEVTSNESIPEQAAGLFCVAKIAGEHAHELCAVQRGAKACDGMTVTYGYDGNFGASNASAASGWHDRTAADEPATLGEFTKEAVSASAKSAKKAGENIGEAASKAGTATSDALKGAGSAIGNATKKTLKCLGSALNDC